MFLSRSQVIRVASLIALPVFILSCGSSHDAEEYYVFVAANLQVPYWKTAGAGFAQAALTSVDAMRCAVVNGTP